MQYRPTKTLSCICLFSWVFLFLLMLLLLPLGEIKMNIKARGERLINCKQHGCTLHCSQASLQYIRYEMQKHQSTNQSVNQSITIFIWCDTGTKSRVPNRTDMIQKVHLQNEQNVINIVSFIHQVNWQQTRKWINTIYRKNNQQEQILSKLP